MNQQKILNLKLTSKIFAEYRKEAKNIFIVKSEMKDVVAIISQVGVLWITDWTCFQRGQPPGSYLIRLHEISLSKNQFCKIPALLQISIMNQVDIYC